MKCENSVNLWNLVMFTEQSGNEIDDEVFFVQSRSVIHKKILISFHL